MTVNDFQSNRVVRAVAPWVGTVVGAVLAGYGYAALVMPNDMLEGGVTGLGMMANKVFGFPPGVTALALTVVIFVVSVRVLGKGFGAKALLGTLVGSLALDLFHTVLQVPALTHNPLLAAFYGGAMCGAGLGLVYFCGAATGGADTLAQMLRYSFGWPVARTLFVIDLCVMGSALFLYGAEQVMYSLLMIVVQVRVIDLVLTGTRANQRLFIISDRSDEIREFVLHDVGRGLTVLRGRGGFTDRDRDILLTVVSRKQLPVLRQAISQIDPHAFVVVDDVNQCYGEGFDRMPAMLRRAASQESAPVERPARVAGAAMRSAARTSSPPA